MSAERSGGSSGFGDTGTSTGSFFRPYADRAGISQGAPSRWF
jgi:hypothetical protein